MNELFELLKSMGMQEYESKAYLYLLENGVCTAEQVSKMGDIPLPRVYETLDSLHNRGIVNVMMSRPKKYHVVSVNSLKTLIEEKREKMMDEIQKAEEIHKRIVSLSPRLKPKMTEIEKQDFWVITGRKNILKSVLSNEKKAEKEILIFGGDLSWYNEFHDVLKKRLKEGVKVRILGHVNNRTKKTIEKLLSIGIEIRDLGITGQMGHIIDDRLIQISAKTPRKGVKEEDYYGIPGNDTLFSYEAITTENPTLVKMFNTYFSLAWTKGKRPDDIFKR